MKTIIAILTILGFAFGAWFYIDGKKADCEDVKKVEETVKKVEKRLDYKILSDQLESTQERIYKIKDRYENKKMDETSKERLHELEQKKEELDRKMKTLEK